MPTIDITKKHVLGVMEAKSRIDRLLTQMSFSGEVSNLTWAWTGNNAAISFTMYGMTFKGTVSITEHEVEVDGTVPLLAMPFRSRIELDVGNKIERALEGNYGRNTKVNRAGS